MQEIGESAKEGGYIMAKACFALAYKARECDSQLKVNERNINKLKFKNKVYRMK